MKDIEYGLGGTYGELDDSYDWNVDIDTNLEYLAEGQDEDDFLFEKGNQVDPFYFFFHFKLVKITSPYIIWILNNHDMCVTDLNYLSLGLLARYISINYERSSTNLVIASTDIPRKVDPSLIALNRLNTCMKIRRLLIPQRWKHLVTVCCTRGSHLKKKMF